MLSNDFSSFIFVVILEVYFLGKLRGEKRRHEPFVKGGRSIFNKPRNENLRDKKGLSVGVTIFSFASKKFLFLLSAVAVIQSIPIFNETGRFSFTLPYPVKIKVRFSFFLQIYLIILFLGK